MGPLENRSVNVVIFCLSLMGTNVNDFLIEANRVLTVGGMLYIAEVESRCQDVKAFTKSIGKFESKHQYFFLAKLTKTHNTSKKFALPRVQLKPCLYKKTLRMMSHFETLFTNKKKTAPIKMFLLLS